MVFQPMRARAARGQAGRRDRGSFNRRFDLESLERRTVLSTLLIPEVSLPRISATFDVTESGGAPFPTDQSVSGGN
jgi:hypothetical protein